MNDLGNFEIHFSVFEKPFAQNNFISFHSNHPSYIFSGIIISQLHRFIMICTNEEDYEFQKQKFFKKLLQKNFPPSLIRKVKKPSFCFRSRYLEKTIKNKSNKIEQFLNPTSSPKTNTPIRFVKRFEKGFDIEQEVHAFIGSIWTLLPSKIQDRGFTITNKVKKKCFRIVNTKSITKPAL